MKKEIEWKSFLFTEVFEILDGYYNKKPPLDNGEIPFLGATLYNNGVTGFCSEEVIRKYDKTGDISQKHINQRIYNENCLVVINNGTAVGNAYYQPFRFTCSHDVTPIYLKNKKMTKNIALFLIPLIEKSGTPFKYANKWRPKRIKRSKIMLPIDDEGKPDWCYMDKFISELKFNVEKKAPIMKATNSVTDLRELTDLQWRQFKMREIFTIESGVRLTKMDMKKGEIPFIGATENNNGVTQFTSIINESLDRNVLGVNYNGSVVESFYHPYNAIFSDDVKRLKLKSNPNNKYVLLFMKTVILKQKVKYAYGYKFNGTRMKEQIILLPINSEGKPDYDFMEDYMKRIENKLTKRTTEMQTTLNGFSDKVVTL